MWKFFDKADVFVLSSTSEGTPKVLLEACARGLPIVASNVSGVTTTLNHKENGYIFQSNDVYDLVKGLKFILNSKKHREIIRKQGIKTANSNTLEYRNKEMVSIISKSFPDLNIQCPFQNT